VISKPGLLKLAKKHPETLATLTDWYKVAKRAEWRGLHQVRRDYPSADQVGDVLIFDVLGGNYRLITCVEYNVQRIYLKVLSEPSRVRPQGVDEMGVKTLDPVAYGKLLAAELP
jgi:mRNA interferase HigB